MALLEDDQMIRDTYRVERLLGKGAFAEVYRVVHPFLGRQAMKVFRRRGLSTDDLEKALGEAVLLSRLGHPNIVRVFDANTFEMPSGVYGYVTMEYVPGGTLADRLAVSRGFLPVSEAVDIVIQVCRGIGVAHQKNPPIIHRDIKPQNLLMGHDDDAARVIVSDFGLAREVNPWTLMASSRGTMAFKAPETFLDPGADSRAGDVWAIGSVLYLLLTAEMPHPELARASGVAAAWYSGRLIPPRELRYVVDEHLEGIVTRALALDPAARYTSAPELLAELEAWRPPAARPPIRPASTAGRPDGADPADPADAAGGVEPPVPGDAAGAAARLVDEALRLTRAGRSAAAASRLTAAYDLVPARRDRHGSRERLSRRGVVI